MANNFAIGNSFDGFRDLSERTTSTHRIADGQTMSNLGEPFTREFFDRISAVLGKPIIIYILLKHSNNKVPDVTHVHVLTKSGRFSFMRS